MAKAKTIDKEVEKGLKIESVKGKVRGLADPGVANPNQNATIYFGDVSLNVFFDFDGGDLAVAVNFPDGSVATGQVVWDE